MVIELMDARATSRAQKALIQLSEDRKETDCCMRNFMRMTDAVAITADEETRIVSTDKKAGRTGGIRVFETKGNARAGRHY